MPISKDMVERSHRERGKKSKARANNTMRVPWALSNDATARAADSGTTMVYAPAGVSKTFVHWAWPIWLLRPVSS